MKRLAAIVMAVILIMAVNAFAKGNRDFQGDSGNTTQNDNQASGQVRQQGAAQQPVVINMNRGSSGGHNRNFPAQQQVTGQQQSSGIPTYGKLQWTQNGQAKQRVQKQPNVRTFQSNNRPNTFKAGAVINQRAGGNNISGSRITSASVVHHHPYEPNYVRKKLQKLGVKSAPGYITNREEVIHTDREHSRIAYPKTGFDNRPLAGVSISSRHFNDRVVKSQMALVGGASWQGKIRGFDRSETLMNHYYWHKDNNFNYCHYIDNSGYHWYGWYVGDKYFWTRNFNNRWWWYDADYDRWCFWNNDFWWWQDPYHMGDLYCYNDTGYIPVNSAEDNVAVTVPDDVNTKTFASPDNTRTVKVVAETQDAFLYDTSDNPSFSPVYLASGVQDVMFSNANNGRPLEIILKLNDGSFDMFDGAGNPYNPGTSDNGQTDQANQPGPGGDAVQ